MDEWDKYLYPPIQNITGEVQLSSLAYLFSWETPLECKGEQEPNGVIEIWESKIKDLIST